MSQAETSIPVRSDGEPVIRVLQPRPKVTAPVAPSPGRFSTERIRRAQDDERDCGLCALQNLYLVCGLVPPTIREMRAILNQHYTTAAHEALGVRPIEQAILLGELRFPRLTSFATMPPNLSARECFVPLIDAGCVLVIGYYFFHAGAWLGHSVVTESWDERGVHVICSASPTYDGQLVEWDITDWVPPAPHPREVEHGNRHIVPWLTQDYAAWVGLPDVPSAGINRSFLIVHPVCGG